MNPPNEEESQAAAAEDVSVADEAQSKAEPARRRPGRPKGSLNKKTLARMAQAEEERRKAEALGLKLEEPVKRKPGRPSRVERIRAILSAHLPLTEPYVPN